jgi:hypothetical protein
MAVIEPADAPPLESLPARQAEALLEALREHNALLDSAYHDARRMVQSGRRPGYIIDFQLLFRHMFPSDDHPEWEQEFIYLFSRPQTRFIIGPGTHAEIDRFLLTRGLVIDSEGTLTRKSSSSGERVEPSEIADARIQLALSRLSDLLAQPNVEPYACVVDEPDVDKAALDTAFAALEKRRRRASREANRADALNWAAVVYLRDAPRDRDLLFYPYLLTATRPLLDERRWSPGTAVPISREPAEVIYTEVLFDHFGENVHEALNHTVEMSMEASALEKELKFSPSLLRPDEYSEPQAWENVIEDGRVGDRLRSQLHGLAQFVSDPVVRKTQQIYDNLRLTAASSSQQDREASESSPTAISTKLFDLIVGINAALAARRSGSEGLASLWKRVLDVQSTQQTGFATHTILDAGSSYVYLAVEVHMREHHAPLFIFRWPSSLDATRVLEAFSNAFERHGIQSVDLAVGMPGRILAPLEAELPLSLTDLVEFARTQSAARLETRQLVGGGVPPQYDGHLIDEVAEMISESDPRPDVAWLRMDSEPFDLYADLISRPPRDPLIGLFEQNVNVDHVVDLYLQTSARYSFRAWLTEAIRSIVDAQCSYDE